MITIQISTKKIKDLIPILQKEMEKNIDGNININIVSTPEYEPSLSWTEDIDC